MSSNKHQNWSKMQQIEVSKILTKILNTTVTVAQKFNLTKPKRITIVITKIVSRKIHK